MIIRKATKKDTKEILEIIKLNSPKYPLQEAKKEILEMFSKSFNKPTYFVAQQEKKIIALGGFIRSWADNTLLEMFWISVHPDFKSRGIGKKIVETLIEEITNLKSKPKPKLILISTKIPSFFEKFGFKIVSRNYDKDYSLMEKRL
jgi:N-acetylglutamate synthase-like GNAT family acetyltransferase